MADELAQRTTESSGPAAEGGATVTPDGVRTSAAEPDLTDPSLYFNRELSWLDFNDRVLQLAEDSRVPLLERVNFCAIYEDNLDEFFMVRVAGLHDKMEQKVDARGADAMSPSDVLGLIRQRVVDLRGRLTRCYEEEIHPALAEHGIRVISLDAADEAEREEVEHLFTSQVFPALTPLVIGRGRPFPYISNMSLSIGVLLRNPEKDEEVAARVKVPKELLRRFLSIGDGLTFVPLEEVIAANLDDLFPGMEIVHHSLFRVTRDTDYDVSDEADDLLLAVEEEVRRRRFGEVVRLEVSSDMAPLLRDQLVEAMGIGTEQVYEVPGLLGLDDLSDIYSVQGYRELRYPPFQGVTPPQLQQGSRTQREVDVFGAMRGADILVHHPYDSFAGSVERFVRQAVEDPNVLAIKQTVYRTSADSPLVPGLIEASERGKQAVCLVELKARFDESANIRWARALEEAGVHVVYGIPGLKTHVKCVLVARREGDGVRNYVHIGTGNYNPKTARLYTDFGLFTADQEIGDDIAEMFNYLTGYARPSGYRKVLVAPFNLKEGMIGEIERTVEAHSPERPARIRMKMNSLLDASCIRALYRASQAGVEVDLNIRGICALRPGVQGVSDNIRVTSVVGRFLEHSRIYSFERNGETTVFMGSADLMPRNLYNRVELIAPVEDPTNRAQLTDVLDRAFADNVSSWELGADGVWSHREIDGDEPRDMQAELTRRHSELAEAAVGTTL
ncbi:MAG TPA: polyphosphate kinase 1 [Solirubrobacterales bacterium]|nr:polyphosphate kinase 1 [Solirubrobacterales bacterium]